ncbi:MAG: zinc metallopeptidase [Chthoniobacterales bacterium]
MFYGLFLFAGTMLLSLWAMWRVKSVYNRYSQMRCASGVTGAQVAQAILTKSGISDVEIVPLNEQMGDHYDPTQKRLVLSEANYYGQSPAALGVAAHECGHAIQHQQAYAPLHLRMAAVTATNFASQIVMILPLIGLMTGMFRGQTMILIMAIAWGVIMVFNLITLPVEFDASRRAKILLGDMGYIGTADEMLGVKRVLNAAGWTYVAAFITSLAYFLWYLLPMLTGGRRNN